MKDLQQGKQISAGKNDEMQRLSKELKDKMYAELESSKQHMTAVLEKEKVQKLQVSEQKMRQKDQEMKQKDSEIASLQEKVSQQQASAETLNKKASYQRVYEN